MSWIWDGLELVYEANSDLKERLQGAEEPLLGLAF